MWSNKWSQFWERKIMIPLGEICTIFQKNGPDFDFDWRPQSRMHHSLLDSEIKWPKCFWSNIEGNTFWWLQIDSLQWTYYQVYSDHYLIKIQYLYQSDLIALVQLTMTWIERSRLRYLPLLCPVRQLGAAVEHNNVILTLGLLSKQHVPHTSISHVSLSWA